MATTIQRIAGLQSSRQGVKTPGQETDVIALSSRDVGVFAGRRLGRPMCRARACLRPPVSASAQKGSLLVDRSPCTGANYSIISEEAPNHLRRRTVDGYRGRGGTLGDTPNPIGSPYGSTQAPAPTTASASASRRARPHLPADRVRMSWQTVSEANNAGQLVRPTILKEQEAPARVSLAGASCSFRAHDNDTQALFGLLEISHTVLTSAKYGAIFIKNSIGVLVRGQQAFAQFARPRAN